MCVCVGRGSFFLFLSQCTVRRAQDQMLSSLVSIYLQEGNKGGKDKKDPEKCAERQTSDSA